MLARWWW